MGENTMRKTDFKITISVENVLSWMGIFQGHHLYEEVFEELQEMLPLAKEKIKPIALLEIGSLKNQEIEYKGEKITEALYSICSIGKEMENWSSRFFAEGDYVKGMLADAIADDYLFQMDGQLEEDVIQYGRMKKKGIVGRAEIPKDFPMEQQQAAYEATGAEKEGILIKPSFMYDPVKTLCSIYLLDDNEKRFRTQHDCRRCDNYTCKRRKTDMVSILVQIEGEEREIFARKSESLLTALQRHQIYLPAICAGRGTCGKCKVLVLAGECPASGEDEIFFSEEELKIGWRLACSLFPASDCKIRIVGNENEMEVVTAHDSDIENGVESTPDNEEKHSFAIAADIGTTTIAMQLVDQNNGSVIDTYTSINRQRAYGADVISRINASNQGKRDDLRAMIQNDLYKGVLSLTQAGTLQVEKMVIGANTTMVHLLMGYSCETLGVYPFHPVNIDTIHTCAKDLLSTDQMDFPITIYPGISTYVGGDITAGLYALDFHKKESVSVLIDLGTNGEMAIGKQNQIYVTSTAAGPAFEGGNITCGTGSIPGAICSVSVDEKKKAKVETIGGKKPLGICGTGVLETTYELLKAGVIEESGLMEEDYFEDGFELSHTEDIRFYQKDIREIQLAKSAVRAGLETLILEYGISYDEIEHIYIGGGFGYKMNVEKAIQIGLFPEECADKIIAIGNSCLKGLVKSLRDPEAEVRFEEIVTSSKEIELSSNKKFQEFYVEYMMF